MKAKVKISCPGKGLEYLLMILKINGKGLLVNHIARLAINDQLELTLQHPNSQKRINLLGIVHKVIQHPNGNKGTIVRFDRLSEPGRMNLTRFLAEIESAEPDQPRESKMNPTASSPREERNQSTLVVPMSSLDHLALESPDQEPHFVTSTLDEEYIHDQVPQKLDGKTTVAFQNEKWVPKRHQKRKSRRRILGSITMVVALTAFLSFYGRDLLGPLGGSSFLAGLDQRFRSNSQRSQAAEDDTRINDIRVEKTKTFTKISIFSGGTIAEPLTTRVPQPKSLAVDFRFFQFDKQLAIPTLPKTGKVATLEIAQIRERARLTIFFRGKNFPRYEIQTYENLVDVLIFDDP